MIPFAHLLRSWIGKTETIGKHDLNHPAIRANLPR